MIRFILAAACLALAQTSLSAQTPPTEISSTQYTFSSDDVYNVLTPGQQRKFDEYQADLRELQTTGRALPDGPSREAVLAAFETKKAERDAEFDFLRGINGQTVTLWGTPPPDPSAITALLVMERRTGIGGMLHPHWYKDREGALIGSASPPAVNGDLDTIPAGPTVDLGTWSPGGASMPPAPPPVSCDETPPSHISNPTCHCYETTVTYGLQTVEQCVWISGG